MEDDLLTYIEITFQAIAIVSRVKKTPKADEESHCCCSDEEE